MLTRSCIQGLELWKKCNINYFGQSVNVFDFFFLKQLRFDRQMTVWLAVAAVTILCHTNLSVMSDLPRISLKSTEHVVYGRTSANIEDKLKAHDDEAQTLEENPITFNILSNDDPDSDEDRRQIDP